MHTKLLEFTHLNFSKIKNILGSPWHEVRLAGLLILVENFKAAHLWKNRIAIAF